MIVRSLDDLQAIGRVVSADGWTSQRLLLHEDGMGFSLHDTTIEAGAVLEMHYKHHLEAVYCIEGEGSVFSVDKGIEHSIVPGTVYALDHHDRHLLTARSTMRMICVFNPPLVGPESHDDEGAYPLLTATTPYDPRA